MWAAAPSASTFRSTSNCRTTSLRQSVIVAKDVAARDRLHAKLEKILAENSRASSRACRRSSSGRRSDGRCNIASAARISIRFVRSLSSSAQIIGDRSQSRKVNFDWIEPAREVRIRVDQDQARLVGLSSQALAEVLNTVMSGTPVTQVRDDIYLVDVIARATDEQRVSLSTLRTLQVPLPNGRTVPLSQFATFEFDQEYPSDLAARPRSDLDCAGGRRRGSDCRRGRSARLHQRSTN